MSDWKPLLSPMPEVGDSLGNWLTRISWTPPDNNVGGSVIRRRTRRQVTPPQALEALGMGSLSASALYQRLGFSASAPPSFVEWLAKFAKAGLIVVGQSGQYERTKS